MSKQQLTTPIQILEETSYFLVLFKPAGLSVHNQSPSVSDFLTANKKPLHFVSRLDQETSGLMIVAKNPDLHELLAESLEEGTKSYRALLRGPWKKPENLVTWKWDITDKAEGRVNPKGISAQRVPAETEVEIIRTNKFLTEIKAVILTGRQHQIRKHAAIAKHPIVGDGRYNDPAYNKKIASLYNETRMYLHAESLEFEFKGKTYHYERPFNLDRFFKASAEEG